MGVMPTLPGLASKPSRLPHAPAPFPLCWPAVGTLEDLCSQEVVQTLEGRSPGPWRLWRCTSPPANAEPTVNCGVEATFTVTSDRDLSWGCYYNWPVLPVSVLLRNHSLGGQPLPPPSKLYSLSLCLPPVPCSCHQLIAATCLLAPLSP